MAGLCGISINPETYQGNFLEDLFWLTSYQQHLGEEYGGLSTYDGERIKIRTHRGLFRATFSEDLLGLEGTEGIGYCGPAREPYWTDSRLGKFSLCFSGNIINLSELVERFKNFGHTFEREDDVEVIAKLIVQGEGIVDGIKRMTNEIKGAYSLLVLASGGIYAACCPTGHWPLVIGEKDGAVAVASDPGGFANLGFSLRRDLEPGEIASLKKGHLETKDKMPSDRVQLCSFRWVYTNFPTAVFQGIPVSAVRKRLGATIARRDIERGFIPDIVVPVPDSGRPCAIGYHQEFCRQMNAGKIQRVPLYDEILLKYPYAGRSYIQPTAQERELEAHIKQVPSGESYKGLVVVVCDDSIRRGTQTERNLVPKLRRLGLIEVHLRISNPDSLSYCPWGKTIQKGELLASRIPSMKERVKFLGVDSLEHTTIEELAEAIGLPLEMLCIDCDLPASK